MCVRHSPPWTQYDIGRSTAHAIVSESLELSGFLPGTRLPATTVALPAGPRKRGEGLTLGAYTRFYWG